MIHVLQTDYSISSLQLSTTMIEHINEEQLLNSSKECFFPQLNSHNMIEEASHHFIKALAHYKDFSEKIVVKIVVHI